MENINIRTKDTITEILIEQIIKCLIPENYNLKQVELAEALGVSRIPIRESLMTLENLGLVYRKSTRHFFTISFSQQEISEIYQLIRTYDLMIINNDFQRLSPLLLQEKNLILTNSYHFHQLLYSHLQNPFFTKQYQTLLMTFIRHGAIEHPHPLLLPFFHSLENQKTITDELDNYYRQMAKNLTEMRDKHAGKS